MIDPEILEACKTSLAVLSRTAIGEGFPPSGCNTKPSLVRPFAEALLLCPEEAAATQQMRRDQLGAKGFLHIACFLVANLDTGKGGIDVVERGTCVGPYFHLASAVLAFIDQFEDYKKPNV